MDRYSRETMQNLIKEFYNTKPKINGIYYEKYKQRRPTTTKKSDVTDPEDK